MSSNQVRHNGYLKSLMRLYDDKYLRSVLYNVSDGKWKEAHVIVRNISNYPYTSNLKKSRIIVEIMKTA